MGGPPSANAFHLNSLGAHRALAACLLASLAVSAEASGLRSGAGDLRTRAAAAGPAQVSTPRDPETMSYLLRTLNRFRSFAESARKGVEARHAAEERHLQEAMAGTRDEGVRLALAQSITGNKQSLLETSRIYNNMANFSDSMMGLLEAATSKGYGCEATVCGPHASCTDTTAGAECVCNEGYVGLGRNCHPPPEFMPHSLLFEGSGGGGALATRATEVHVNVFELNKIAVVFRDMSQESVGRVLVGKVREAGLADIAPPEQFTLGSGRAFSPVVAGTGSRRIVIAWRDENKMATCWMRGAALGATGVRGADMALTFGEPVNFCSSQAHKMAILPFPQDRIVILFSDKAKATQHSPLESFGSSLLAQVGPTGQLGVLGRFRFSDYPVCRLEATKVSSGGFVLAARAGEAVDEMDATRTKQEAMAVYGEVLGDDLVFDPNPLNLEPGRAQIWSRGVSLIAPNTVGYAYQDGTDMSMKLAVVEIDPKTHRMKVVSEPVVLRRGFSPYVSMLSVPYTASDPHTLVYYQTNQSSMVNLCSWGAAAGRLGGCEDFPWLSEPLASVSGVHLGGGKSFMVFAPRSGIPYYGVFGLSKK